MNTIHLKFAGIALGAVVVGAALGGCAGSVNHYVQDAPISPVSRQALADEVYLDGTGPTARRAAGGRDNTVEMLQVAPPPSSGPSHAVARTRPTAIPRAEDMSASTTGARNSTQGTSAQSAQGDPNKPFSDQWWEKEKREDARLRDRMNICRGC